MHYLQLRVFGALLLKDQHGSRRRTSRERSPISPLSPSIWSCNCVGWSRARCSDQSNRVVKCLNSPFPCRAHMQIVLYCQSAPCCQITHRSLSLIAECRLDTIVSPLESVISVWVSNPKLCTMAADENASSQHRCFGVGAYDVVAGGVHLKLGVLSPHVGRAS